MVTMRCCCPLPTLLADGCEGRGGGSVAGRKVHTCEDTCRRACRIVWHAAVKDGRTYISTTSSRCCISTLTGRPPQRGFMPVVRTVARHTTDFLLVNDWLLYTFMSMSLETRNGKAEEECVTCSDEMLKYAWTEPQVMSNLWAKGRGTIFSTTRGSHSNIREGSRHTTTYSSSHISHTSSCIITTTSQAPVSL